ncbi:MAG TPA: hypothetical protein VF853_09955 [Candidatus Deferrimicrobiaceae bacterium]
MFRRILSAAFLVSVLAATGYAADLDNAAVAPSYFEGVWAGTWPAYLDPTTRQDITITIHPGKMEGVLVAEYEWSSLTLRNRTLPAGKVKAKGSQEGDTFTFGWQNKEGRDLKITLNKQTEDTVKARIDRGGTLRPEERPYTETTLKRK